MNISNFKSGLNYDFPPPFFGLGLPPVSCPIFLFFVAHGAR